MMIVVYVMAVMQIKIVPGVCDGSSSLDDCGVCDGGNADQDCAGVCFGGSSLDDCGVCDGGNADDLGCGCGEAAPSGCDDTCGSTLADDDCWCMWW